MDKTPVLKKFGYSVLRKPEKSNLIVSKNVKEGTLWEFLNIYSVAKFQKFEARLETFCKKTKENFQQS